MNRLDKQRIGIIAAMATEVTRLHEHLAQPQRVAVGGIECFLGKIADHEVAVMQCGIGKVSAGAGAQALISEFHPDCIINTGCAGALAPQLAIGDIVLATCTAEWDLDIMKLGFPRGHVMSIGCVKMAADEGINAAIKAVLPQESHVHEGLVVSGDQFVASMEQRKTILEAFPDALCTEMEGAAIGHVCTQNHVPFAVIRCMSDTADSNSSVDFDTFSQEAGEKSAERIIAMLSNGAV